MGDEVGFEDFLLVEDFNGEALVGGRVAGKVDFGESAVAEEFAEFVAPEEEVGVGGGGGRGGASGDKGGGHFPKFEGLFL